MGIRETLEKKKWLATVLACLLIAGAGAAIILQAREGGPNTLEEMYYTTDDGKTYSPDSAKKLMAPAENGQPAVRAHLFECGGKPVVGYLSRYSPEALKTIQEFRAAQAEGKPAPDPAKLSAVARTGMELKKPGDTTWVSMADTRRATPIINFRCPDGSVPGPAK